MQGAILVVSSDDAPQLTDALGDGGSFTIARAHWPEAIKKLGQVKPIAVVAVTEGARPDLVSVLAAAVGRLEPYVPMIAAGKPADYAPNALPFSASPLTGAETLRARLRSALRVRALHATVLRRAAEGGALPETDGETSDPIEDATILLVGRGASYPALSLAAGERFGVIGSLSVEAAAGHLNNRDIDGVILGEGFSARVIDAFLMVLSEDARFRNLPVVTSTGCVAHASYDLPNFEIVDGAPRDVVAAALPLVRQQAFEARLGRMLKSIEAAGMLDARTGLLTPKAFALDFHRVVGDALAANAALSAARFVFPSTGDRAGYDAARVLGRLMRKIDFATRQADNSVIVVFSDTDLAGAHVIARRLAAVLRQTMLGASAAHRLAPEVTLATLRPGDTAQTLLARLNSTQARAAS